MFYSSTLNLPGMTGEMTDEDRDFYRWYGPWRPFTPRGLQRLMRGSNIRWWIVGGWAVDAFTAVSREHEDIDVSFFRSDLPYMLEHLAPRYCVWSNLSAALFDNCVNLMTCSRAPANYGYVEMAAAHG